MKYEIKVKLIETQTGDLIFQDSIEYSEKWLEMALDFVAKLANSSNNFTRYGFEIIKKED